MMASQSAIVWANPTKVVRNAIAVNKIFIYVFLKNMAFGAIYCGSQDRKNFCVNSVIIRLRKSDYKTLSFSNSASISFMEKCAPHTNSSAAP